MNEQIKSCFKIFTDIHEESSKHAMHYDRPLSVAAVQKSNIDKLIKDYVLALQIELGEFLGELNWKPWKRTKKEENKTRVLDEFADIVAFFGVILWLLQLKGYSLDDIVEAYVKKETVNMNRFTGGY